MDRATAQFFVDSTWAVQLPRHQVELLCLSQLHAALMVNRGLPKEEHWPARLDEVQAFYNKMVLYRIANDLFDRG